MRLVFLVLLLFSIPAKAQTANPLITLQNLSTSVREGEKQTQAIKTELERLQAEEQAIMATLIAQRYEATTAYHALQSLRRTSGEYIYLLPDSEYRDRLHSLRRSETIKDILMHRIDKQTESIINLQQKQDDIRGYIRRRDRLALTIQSTLQRIKTLNRQQQTDTEFQTLLNEIEMEAESLDGFLKQLLQLPESVSDDQSPLVFTLPVSGIINPTQNGIEINAAAQALVTAPARGHVAFAGDFKPLGQVVIINHGQGYISILQNLGEIYVQEGFFVQGNDPIGILSVENSDKSGNSTMLYYELRYNHSIINPIDIITGL